MADYSQREGAIAIWRVRYAAGCIQVLSLLRDLARYPIIPAHRFNLLSPGSGMIPGLFPQSEWHPAELARLSHGNSSAVGGTLRQILRCVKGGPIPVRSGPFELGLLASKRSPQPGQIISSKLTRRIS